MAAKRERKKAKRAAPKRRRNGVYYTVRIPWAPPGKATKWHPTEKTGPFSILTRGAFPTIGKAIHWANENLNGTSYSVQEIDEATGELSAAARAGQKNPRRRNNLPVGRSTGFSVRISRKGYGPFTISEGGAMSEARAKRVASAHARQGYRADVMHGSSVVDVFPPSKSNPPRKKRKVKRRKAPAKRRRMGGAAARQRRQRERVEAYTAGVVAALRKEGYRVRVKRGERR